MQCERTGCRPVAGAARNAARRLECWVRLLERLAPDALLAAEFGLTPREADVARHIAVGRSNRGIAAALAISPETARKHAEHVRAKLRVGSRAAVGFRLMLVAMDAREG